MSLVRYEPWGLFSQVSQELGRQFHHAQHYKDASEKPRNWSPAVDIKESEQAYTLIADVPGVNPENIDVHMEDGVLSLRGERSQDEQKGYKHVERAHGRFYRRFTLPDTVDADNISAKFNNGVLEVTIPKQEKLQARKITVSH